MIAQTDLSVMSLLSEIDTVSRPALDSLQRREERSAIGPDSEVYWLPCYSLENTQSEAPQFRFHIPAAGELFW